MIVADAGLLSGANIEQLEADKYEYIRGYNRFLTLDGDTIVTIDSGNIAAEALLDGLKGFVTNSNISDGEVIENYRNLHFIERAFYDKYIIMQSTPRRWIIIH